MQHYLPMASAIALPNMGGIINGIFMRDDIKNWYPTLKKPEWRPPNWAFGPVWTTLYSSIGYASYLVYTNGNGFEVGSVAFGLPYVGGFINTVCQYGAKKWYEDLKKTWICSRSYLLNQSSPFKKLTGAAVCLVYVSGNGFKGAAKLPLMAYGANLALNWAWSPIFFNFKKLDWALYEILLLDISTVATGYLFYQVNKTAGYLFVPYAMWLSLATALTYRIYKDNPKQGKAKITELKDH